MLCNSETVGELTSLSGVICRICLENIPENLISPCNCKGTSAYIHESCLKKWIMLNYKSNSDLKCEICGHEYKLITKYYWTINLNRGLDENFKCCISIPILLSIFIAMIIVDIILTLSHIIRFDKIILSSTLIIISCALLTLASLVLLILFIKAALIYKSIKDIIILNHPNP